MKWIGQHIWDFISRFRNSVYLEGLSDPGSDTDKFLVIDGNDKIGYRTGAEVLSDIGASSESTDLEFSGDTANGVLTYGGAAQIDVESTLTYNGGNLSITSSDTGPDEPIIELRNTNADALGPTFRFNKTETGADNDVLGTIDFKGDNDNNEQYSFASIVALIDDAADGAEAGGLTLNVAEYDGTLTSGIRLTGNTDANGEVDVNIGAGAASTTTIAGTLTMGSTAFVNNSGVVQVATQGTIDHDSLANYAANEHFTQANIVATGTIASGTWEGTAIADTYVANDLTISGGTVNNSVIGGSTPAAITGTTIDANTDFTVGTTVITDDQIQFTPSTNDTATIAAGANGALGITTVDTAGAQATLDFTADGNINTISSTCQINQIYDFHTAAFETVMVAGKPSGKVIRYEPNGDSTPTSGQVYYLRTNGAWLQANADAESTTKGLLGLGFGASSQTQGLLLEGFMRVAATEILNIPGSGNVDGLPVYLATTSGHLDFTAPSSSTEFVRVLGYAIDDALGDVLIYFNPDKTYIEIA